MFRDVVKITCVDGFEVVQVKHCKALLSHSWVRMHMPESSDQLPSLLV